MLPDWRPELNRDALAAYLRLAYVPSPHSIYRGIDKLAPGHIATIDADGKVEISAFWSVEQAAERGKSARFDVSDREATDTLEMLLGDAVGRRLVADVPLGAFLSGGIDSSAVAAMMRMRSNAPVRTYSIGFKEEGFDEAPHARAVAAHLGTEHTELYVSPAEAQGGHSGAADHLRRALRRFIASADLSPVEAHPRACHRGAVRRRRR